jgi:hypothetical protein
MDENATNRQSVLLGLAFACCLCVYFLCRSDKVVVKYQGNINFSVWTSQESVTAVVKRYPGTKFTWKTIVQNRTDFFAFLCLRSDTFRRSFIINITRSITVEGKGLIDWFMTKPTFHDSGKDASPAVFL